MSELPLSDYALIGNCRAAALVSKSGSIDWCCLPEFDSPAIFAALLDRKNGGYFAIAPIEKYRAEQHYIPETNVVETTFITGEGEVRLRDAFVAQREESKLTTLFPEHEILRTVTAVHGSVRMKLEYWPRLRYGQQAVRMQDREMLGIQFARKEHVYTLLTTLKNGEIRVRHEPFGNVLADFVVSQKQCEIFSLSYCSRCPTVLPELRSTGVARMDKTVSFWTNWSRQCKYSGMYASEVKRSALVLKLLTYAPSGAIIAAPTTSLPEHPGGERNWDYRFCWLRDASFTTRAFVNLGYEEEIHAYMNWILHTTRLTRPRLQVVYSVFGEARLKEKVVNWLAGYRDSRPVRIGNEAVNQLQLDVYGEVLDAAYTYSRLVQVFDRDTRRFLIGLGKSLCKLWSQPDNGIWEIRWTRVHHTHSKVMAWVGLDRLIKLCERYNWKHAPLKSFKETADRIRDSIERDGYNVEMGTYTRELHGTSVDASSLVFSLVGYADATSDRMISTVNAVWKQLVKNDLVYRYRDTADGLTGNEGTFGVCTFWLAENLARMGRLKDAVRVFETMLKCASDTGLLSEEVDADTGTLVGNYPQGFTHIGLINAAMTIDKAHQET